jgi:DNA-binding winged helix-turn-helix (wHTH) protein
MTIIAKSANRKVCPLCGQHIFVPNEFTKFSLTYRQRLILFRLCAHYPHTATYEDLWGDRPTSRKTMHVHLARIRKCIRDSGLTSRWRIVTVRPYGYMLQEVKSERNRTPQRSQTLHP